MGSSLIPPPLDGDHEEVHWALSTAASLQASGEFDEALRWLRRAVAAAVACDHDTRAIELGRLAAELEERLGGATTQRGGDDRDPLTHSDRLAGATSELETPRLGDSAKYKPSFVDEEVTIVPFTMKAAGVEAGEVVRRLGSKTLKVEDVPFLRRPSEPSPPDRSPPPREERDSDEEEVSRPTHVSERFDPSTIVEDDEPTIASWAEVSRPPASSSTMPALTRWRVALLASADDDQPRVLYLGPGVAAPAGAAVAFLMPSSEEDARLMASLLRLRR